MSPVLIVSIVLGSLLLFALSVFVSIGAALYRYAILRTREEMKTGEELYAHIMLHKCKKPSYAPLLERGADWLRAHRDSAPEAYIESFDGLRLYAAIYEAPDPKGVIVLSHGFHSSGEADFCAMIPFYLSLGYSLLQIDHRAHRHSEGKHLTFGVRERYDLRAWLRFAEERWRGIPVVLSGVSMGCASALMAAQLPDLPACFCGVIADCGYDSPYEEVLYFTNMKFHLPAFLVAPSDLLCRVFARFSLKDCRVTDGSARISVPVFCMHGTGDVVVPISDMKRIYDTLTCDKTFLIAEGAPHGSTSLEIPEKCRAQIGVFLDKCRADCEKRAGLSKSEEAFDAVKHSDGEN